MNRRDFIKSALIVCAAPLVVRAESLMAITAPKLIVPSAKIIRPQIFYVDSHAGNDKKSGDSWENAWATMPHAMSKVTPVDKLYINNATIESGGVAWASIRGQDTYLNSVIKL